jgi:acyl-CoA synthetase (AMP-forming)/AMP-acid ligase II
MNFVDYLFEISHVKNKDAVVGNSETVSYPDLYRQVNRIAHFLSRAVGEDQKIILISENSVFFIAAYLGIIKSGNVCVPLNPAITASGLTHIMNQCATVVGFLQEKSLQKHGRLFQHAYDESAVNAFPDPEYPLESEDYFGGNRLAEILFTSGSTALPKGVMLSHGNLIANSKSIIEYLSLTENDRMEVVLPFYYCYGLSLLHTHLRVGGSMVLNNTFMMLNTVIDDLKNYECTGFAGVPSHFQILLRKSGWFREMDFPHLKYVTQAGGKLPKAFIKEFAETFPEVKFYVMYGQTEATARLSYLPPDLVLAKLGSIGKGIPGIKLQVLNKNGAPVQPGEVGELAASGKNIMLGYFHDEELTRRTIRNGNLYTGDLGTVDEDGFIYIVAREKEFLKVGGERVSPKEIEEVIVRFPEVLDCSILGVPDAILGEAVKALVVLNGQSLTEKDIIAHCTRHLSSVKIPKYIEFIDKIPVSDTGKKVKAQLIKLNQ